MAKKVTTKGLAKAIEEHLDAQALLQTETYQVKVQPATVLDAQIKQDKLVRMLDRVKTEERDSSLRGRNK